MAVRTWIGTKKVAFVLADFSGVRTPIQLDEWKTRSTRIATLDYPRYVTAASYGAAAAQVKLFGPVDLVDPTKYTDRGGLGFGIGDALKKASEADASLKDFDIACVIFLWGNGGGHAFMGAGSGISGAKISGTCYVERNAPLGVYVMETFHVATDFGDLYGTWNQPGQYDVMDCSCDVQPGAFTKQKLGWLGGTLLHQPQGMLTSAFASRDFFASIPLAPLAVKAAGTAFNASKIPLTADGKQFYTVELRRKSGAFDGSIPADGVVVNYVDEREWPDTVFQAVHRRALLQNVGDKFVNETCNGLTLELIRSAPDSATVQLSVKTPGAMRRVASRELAAFYASESAALARLGGYSWEGANVKDNAVHHHRWAAGRTVDVVESQLLEKVRLQYERQAAVSGDAAANLYADTTIRLTRYRVNMGGSLTYTNSDGFHSLDRSVHFGWARSQGSTALSNGTRDRIRALFQHFQEGRKKFLESAFTREALALADIGGMTPGTRNSPDPNVHITAARAMTPAAMAQELVDRYDSLFFILHSRGARAGIGPVELYTSASLRLNAYGVSFGSTPADSLVASVHSDWARVTPVRKLQEETARRIRTLFA